MIRLGALQRSVQMAAASTTRRSLVRTVYPSVLSAVRRTPSSATMSTTTTDVPPPLPQDNNTNGDDLLYPVYVHQVSKTVLQHLQHARSEWLQTNGLGLRINPNGTFVLHFPSDAGSDGGRIWTSYDKTSERHWLSLYQGKFAGSFLLKDAKSMQNMFPTLDSKEQYIRSVVDEMISTSLQQ